jgi:hypothetical protein
MINCLTSPLVSVTGKSEPTIVAEIKVATLSLITASPETETLNTLV